MKKDILAFGDGTLAFGGGTLAFGGDNSHGLDGIY